MFFTPITIVEIPAIVKKRICAKNLSNGTEIFNNHLHICKSNFNTTPLKQKRMPKSFDRVSRKKQVMKTNKLKIAVVLSAACAMTFSACKKENMEPMSNNPANEKRPLHFSFEIRSNEGFRQGIEDPGFTVINRNTYGASFIGEVHLSVHGELNSMYPSGMNGYGQSPEVGITAITYNEISTHYPMIYFTAHPTSGVTGNSFRIQYSGFDMNVDEIEVNPDDSQVYALATYGSTKALYKLVPNTTTGIADATWMGELFHNFAVNGYIGGSIAFVQDQTTAAWHLSFTSESTVYSTLGIVQWNYTVGTSSIASDATAHPNCYYASGIANAGTGNINTVAFNGDVYFARDNETLYKFVPASGGGSSTVTSIGSISASHDFGPDTEISF
ncbi:MAG: hypothetical protein JWP12_2571 [Bacteroidetes bacterium]|nr:hypothetical protein [Bacteroidota bacterium]